MPQLKTKFMLQTSIVKKDNMNILFFIIYQTLFRKKRTPLVPHWFMVLAREQYPVHSEMISRYQTFANCFNREKTCTGAQPTSCGQIYAVRLQTGFSTGYGEMTHHHEKMTPEHEEMAPGHEKMTHHPSIIPPPTCRSSSCSQTPPPPAFHPRSIPPFRV